MYQGCNSRGVFSKIFNVYLRSKTALTHLAVSSGRKGKEIFLSAVQKKKVLVFLSVT